MPSKPRAWPLLPAAAVFALPRYRALNGAGVGIFWRLTEHFWLTECAPLPRSDGELFQISRAHRPTWAHYRTEILAIFEEARPILESAFRQFRARQRNSRILFKRGAEAMHAKRRALALQEATHPLEPATIAPMIPTKAPNSPALERQQSAPVATETRKRLRA